jgi:uncharacterized protein YjgD (DUF1641 family)
MSTKEQKNMSNILNQPDLEENYTKIRKAVQTLSNEDLEVYLDVCLSLFTNDNDVLKKALKAELSLRKTLLGGELS